MPPESPSESQTAVEWLEPLWSAAQQGWENEAVHRAILVLCDRPERLAIVARRYREAAADPARTQTARRQLDAITALAFAQLTPRERPREPGRVWKVLLILLFLAGSFALARHL